MEEQKELFEDFSIIVSVFSFLSAKELCFTAALVCKRWATISNEPLVHRNRYQLHTKEQLLNVCV